MILTVTVLAISQCAGPGMFGSLLDPRLVASGHQSPFTEQQAVTVRSEKAWKTVASELGIQDGQLAEMTKLHGPLHNMDWNSEMLVVAAAGMRPSGGFNIQWVRATTTPGNMAWKLTARLSAPGPNEAVTLAMTTPWAAYRLQAVPGRPSYYVEVKTRGQ